MARFAAPILMALCLAVPACGQVAGWRGDGTGNHPAAEPPEEWGPKKNVLWSVEVGESPFCSPVAAGEKVFVPIEPSTLVCLDAATGKKLWEKASGFADLEPKQEDKPTRGEAKNCTPTPVSDGQLVWAAFGNGIVACYDLAGERKWIRHYGRPCELEHGRSASPLLVGDKLILSQAILFAVDAKTGKELWKAEKVSEAYGSPVAAKIGGADAIVTPSGEIVRAADGAIVASGLGQLKNASPLIQDGFAYFLDVEAIAVKLPDKIEDKMKLKAAWSVDLEGEFIASGVVSEGFAFVVSNEGNLFAIDLKEGNLAWRKELAIANASGRPDVQAGHLYASLSVAGKSLFLSNDQGETLVIAPGKEFKAVRTNTLDDGSGGTPAFAGKRIFVREGTKVTCLEAKK